MSFTHIVTFKWRAQEFVEQPLAEAPRDLVPSLDSVQDYVCAPDTGLTPSSYDFAVVGTFDSREAFAAYRD